MDELPLITIGVSAYNRERFLPASLDSLLAQSYPNIEIIVVDDGSVDHTREMIQEKYPQVKYIYKTNGGDASAKNRAAREAKGAFILFNDSDDLFYPDTVERLYKTLLAAEQEFGREAIAYGGYSGIDEFDRRYETRGKAANLPSGEITGKLIDHVLVSSCGTLMRRDTFLAEGGYDENLRCMHDWKLSLKLSLKYPFKAADQPVFLRRRHSSNLSAASYRGTLTGCHVLEEFLAEYPEQTQRFAEKIRRRRAVLNCRLAREGEREKLPKAVICGHLKNALAQDFKLKYLFRYGKALLLTRD